MFKSPKHIKDQVLRIGLAIRTFLSFRFLSFGIVSDFEFPARPVGPF